MKVVQKCANFVKNLFKKKAVVITSIIMVAALLLTTGGALAQLIWGINHQQQGTVQVRGAGAALFQDAACTIPLNGSTALNFGDVYAPNQNAPSSTSAVVPVYCKNLGSEPIYLAASVTGTPTWLLTDLVGAGTYPGMNVQDLPVDPSPPAYPTKPTIKNLVVNAPGLTPAAPGGLGTLVPIPTTNGSDSHIPSDQSWDASSTTLPIYMDTATPYKGVNTADFGLSGLTLPCYIKVDNEIMKVTTAPGGATMPRTFTVERAQKGSTAVAHSGGAQILWSQTATDQTPAYLPAGGVCTLSFYLSCTAQPTVFNTMDGWTINIYPNSEPWIP